YGRAGIKDYQDTGRGRIVMRARAVIEEKESSSKAQIVVNELPYQVNKAKLVADIAELVRDKKLEGISDLRDESDKDGMRIVIKLIRAAADTPTGSTQLQKKFELTEKQAEAILNMRLAKLTGLEIDKLEAELKEVRGLVKEFKSILASRPRRMKIMREELEEAAKKFGDDRRSEITSDEGEFTIEDLIAEEDMVITISHSGYIKRTSVSTYRKQRRGGRGLSGQGLKDED